MADDSDDVLSDANLTAAQAFLARNAPSKGWRPLAPWASALPLRWVDPASIRTDFADVATPTAATAAGQAQDHKALLRAAGPSAVYESGVEPPVLTTPLEQLVLGLAEMVEHRATRLSKRITSTQPQAQPTRDASRHSSLGVDSTPFTSWAVTLFQSVAASSSGGEEETRALASLLELLATSQALCLPHAPPEVATFQSTLVQRVARAGSLTEPVAAAALSSLLALGVHRGAVGDLCQVAATLLCADSGAGAEGVALDTRSFVHVANHLAAQCVAAPTVDARCAGSWRCSALAASSDDASDTPQVAAALASDGKHLYVHMGCQIRKVSVDGSRTPSEAVVKVSGDDFEGERVRTRVSSHGKVRLSCVGLHLTLVRYAECTDVCAWPHGWQRQRRRHPYLHQPRVAAGRADWNHRGHRNAGRGWHCGVASRSHRWPQATIRVEHTAQWRRW